MRRRFGAPADENPLARLAALDSSKPPAQPGLLARVVKASQAERVLVGDAGIGAGVLFGPIAPRA